VLDMPAPPQREEPVDLRDLRELVPSAEAGREIDDWGRSQRIFDLVEPLLDFYYRYWFRVEVEGIENVPSDGGALIVSNHSGALPPDAPMIMQALRHEHPRPRPLYMLGENWFKGYPGVGMLANKIGLVGAHPENAQRLLRDEGRLVLVFPEGQKGSRKLFWQRYRLRRFGRGGFVRTAMRAGVPIVPVAVIGAEEAMPIFAHVPLLERLTGLIYFPINHAFPHFGLAAAAMYLPAKFRIRFLEPIDMSPYAPEDADDIALVGRLSERIRMRIQEELDDLLLARKSVWFG
jgi:1-acyl-sn-glycerol-3-phosphate acyltransferase